MTAGLAGDGARRGLEATSNAEGHFAILALDHVDSMAATMVPDDPDVVTADQLVNAKAQLTRRLRDLASAVLLDPMDGYATDHTPAELAGGIGLVLGIEAGDHGSGTPIPRLRDGWSVERAAAEGADAVKISFRFDPTADVDSVERFVTEVAEESRRCGLPLFAEPLGVFPSPADRLRVTIEAARRFGSLGVDVLKLEFPADVSEAAADESAWLDACVELDAACAVPWTVLSGGEPFDRFVAMVRVAGEAGASGFVAGRAVWREAVEGGAVRSTEQAAARLAVLAAALHGRARPWLQHPHWRAAT